MLAVYVERTKQSFGHIPGRPTLAVGISPGAAASDHNNISGSSDGGGTAVLPALPRLVSMQPELAHQRGRLRWRQLFYLPVDLPADDEVEVRAQHAATMPLAAGLWEGKAWPNS